TSCPAGPDEARLDADTRSIKPPTINAATTTARIGVRATERPPRCARGSDIDPHLVALEVTRTDGGRSGPTTFGPPAPHGQGGDPPRPPRLGGRPAAPPAAQVDQDVSDGGAPQDDRAHLDRPVGARHRLHEVHGHGARARLRWEGEAHRPPKGMVR